MIPLALTEQGSVSLINGSVSAITGDFTASYQDIVLPGPEPLMFQRFYASSYQNLAGETWIDNHGSEIFLGEEFRGNTLYAMAKYYGPLGSSAQFGAPFQKKGITSLSIDLQINGKGLTNLGSGVISGQTNFKNIRINCKAQCQNFQVTLGSDAYCDYKHVGNNLYQITSKTTAKGNKFIYEYHKDIVSQIKAVNASGTVFSWLKLIKDEKQKSFSIQSSDGRTLFAKYTKIRDKKYGTERYFFSEFENVEGPKEIYEYTKGDHLNCEKITCIRRPDGRFVANEYYVKGSNTVLGNQINVKDNHDHRFSRVKCQMAPVGPDSTPIITHNYFYDIKTKKRGKTGTEFLGGTTEVYNAYNNKCIYSYGADQRISTIERFSGRGPYYRHSVETLIWGAANTPNHTNLLCKYVSDANATLCARSYTYDAAGNILEDRLYGNHTGKNSPPIVMGADSLPVNNGCECLVTTYRYTADGCNKMTFSGEANGRYTNYGYKPGTDLLVAKLICEWQPMTIRELNDYDGNGVLIKSIIEDGQSEKHITYFTPKAAAPGLGLPEIKTEYYFDFALGQEVLLNKKIFTYSPEGRLIREDLYDNTNTYYASLSWEYDKKGNLIREQNALGEVIVKHYDANNNLIFKQGPRQDAYTEYTYDFSNRLIRVDEKQVNGPTYTTTHRYDYLNNRTATVDHFGQESQYFYDEFGRIIKTILPGVPDGAGRLACPIISKTYDVLGNVTSVTDPLGYTTTTTYTITGKPVHTHYPDGTSETNEYNLDGTLRKNIGKTGLITLYSYDIFYRPTVVQVYSADNQLLSTTSKTYNSFHVTSETDAEGVTTSYQYDGAGRLISKRRNDLVTAYEYNNLNQLYKIKEWFGPNETDVTIKIEKFDLLNRLIEQHTEDFQGNILIKVNYAYDAAGNRTQVISSENAITYTEYNNHNQPIKITNAEGHVTHIEYDINYVNAQGQRVLRTTTTDPLGHLTIVSADALNRPVSILHKNPFGLLTGKQEIVYDLAGNKLFIKETVLTPGAPDRPVHTFWSYNSMNQVLTMTEAWGTHEQKQTLMVYNNYGQKEKIIKADGVIINHSYDALGRLAQFSAADDSFSYNYSYDKNNNLVAVENLKSHTKTSKL
jgi:YD repeat-containing protein